MQPRSDVVDMLVQTRGAVLKTSNNGFPQVAPAHASDTAIMHSSHLLVSDIHDTQPSILEHSGEEVRIGGAGVGHKSAQGDLVGRDGREGFLLLIYVFHAVYHQTAVLLCRNYQVLLVGGEGNMAELRRGNGDVRGEGLDDVVHDGLFALRFFLHLLLLRLLLLLLLVLVDHELVYSIGRGDDDAIWAGCGKDTAAGGNRQEGGRGGGKIVDREWLGEQLHLQVVADGSESEPLDTRLACINTI